MTSISRVQCLACGGTYAPMQADGTSYAHACPSLSVSELTAALATGIVVLPLGETPEIAVARRTYVRADARDDRVGIAGAGIATVVDLSADVVTVATPPIKTGGALLV